MYKNKRILKDKGIIIMSVVSVLAISGLIGSIMISDNRDSGITKIAQVESSSDSGSEKILADNGQNANANVKKETEKKTENEIEQKESSTLPTDDLPQNDAQNVPDTDSGQNSAGVTDNISVAENTPEESTVSNADTAGDADNASVNAPALSPGFTNESVLVWPVETSDIVIEYSMDKTTYFATLDMYKTSDAVCIRSDVGSPVYAAADGVVSLHSYNEEVGHFIQMDLGNDYALTYGQLKDIQIEEGDVLAKGDLIGYIAEPTKYYTVEGANLYLKLTQNGTPADPLDYLDYDEP